MQQRFVLAFAGMSNVGKSTLINALLGADLAPNANRPCTAAPIEFEYAIDLGVTISSDDSISRRRWDCRSIAAVRACLDRIAQDGSEMLESHGSRIVVQVPAPLLQAGLVIADTPGFSAAKVESSAGRHDEVFLTYLRERASYVFCVMMADQGIGKREMEFFRNDLAALCDDLLVTGCDDWQSSDCDRYRARFLHEFGADPPAFHFVSGKHAIKARTVGDRGLLEASGISRLETRLRELSAPVGRVDSTEKRILKVAADLAARLIEYRDQQNRPLSPWWRPDSWANWVRIPPPGAIHQQLTHLLQPR